MCLGDAGTTQKGASSAGAGKKGAGGRDKKGAGADKKGAGGRGKKGAGGRGKKGAGAGKKGAGAGKKGAGAGKKGASPNVLRPGMLVTGKWNEPGENQGNWYDGKVVSVNTKKKTIHVEFLDGDVDTALPWKDVVIPDQEEEVKG